MKGLTDAKSMETQMSADETQMIGEMHTLYGSYLKRDGKISLVICASSAFICVSRFLFASLIVSSKLVSSK